MDLQQDDLTSEFVITNGDLTQTTGIDSIRQFIAQRLRTGQDEWFLDGSIGVPYLQRIFDKGVPLLTLDTIFKDVILNSIPQISLTSFSLNLDARSRALSLSFTAECPQGEIQFNNFVITG